MDLTLWFKFNQHKDLKEELLATGDAELIEVCGGHLFPPRFHEIYIENTRTPTRMPSGVVVLMERARMSLGKRL